MSHHSPHSTTASPPAHDMHAGHHPGHHPDASDHDAPAARRPWTVLALMLAAQIMVVLDVSVVNVALPSIATDLQLSSSDYQWLISAYVLLSGGFLLLGGRIADLFDRRRVFLTGLTLFTAGSLTAGFADTALTLIAARGAQGAGAALLTPAAMSIVMATLRRPAAGHRTRAVGHRRQHGHRRRRPVRRHPHHRVRLARRVLHQRPHRRRRRRRRPGQGPPRAHRNRAPPPARPLRRASLLVTGLLTLVYAVESTTSHGWTAAQTLVAAGIAADPAGRLPLQRAQGREPHRPARHVAHPVPGLRVGRDGRRHRSRRGRHLPQPRCTCSRYLARPRSSPVCSSCRWLPSSPSAPPSRRRSCRTSGRRSSSRWVWSIATAGALVLSFVDADPSYLSDVLPGFALLGLGVGPMFVAISVAAMSDVAPEQSGLASGLLMTGHEIGAALGVAALTAVAGDLTTRAGIASGSQDAFLAIAIGLVALLVPTFLLPAHDPAHASTGHGHGHGH